MNTLRGIVLILLVGLGPHALARRQTVPFLCSNIGALFDDSSIAQLAQQDHLRRHQQVMAMLGPEKLAQIEKAIGFSPFHKVQTEQEALALFEKLVNDPQAHEPIQQILSEFTGPERWALYLITGFHAISTHTDGHRSMVAQSVDTLPQSAVFGGNFPRWLDVGIGNGNLVARGMATNPRAMVWGLDVAGGSLSRSMDVLNSISDRLQAQHPGPKTFDYGRFGLFRGSASDAGLLGGQQFDGITSVLTVFAIPQQERLSGVKLMADRLVPGGTYVLIDPTPEFSRNTRPFLRKIISDSFHNNEEMTALDIAILSVMNMGDLRGIKFMDPHEQKNLGIAAGLEPVGPSQPVYYGFANMQAFQKPGKAQESGPETRSPERHLPLSSKDLSSIESRVQNEIQRRAPGLDLSRAGTPHGTEVETFIRKERAKLGVVLPPGEVDLNHIDREITDKGGYLYTLREPSGKIVGTFAFVPTGPKSGEIRKMYLSEEYKGNGLGENILDSMVRFAADQGYNQIYAETMPALQSKPMFERAGFVVTGKPEGAEEFIPSGGIWMVKTMPQ